MKRMMLGLIGALTLLGTAAPAMAHEIDREASAYGYGGERGVTLFQVPRERRVEGERPREARPSHFRFEKGRRGFRGARGAGVRRPQAHRWFGR